MTADPTRNPLWLILVEVAQSLPLYNAHRAYVKDYILLETPEVTPEEVAYKLDTTLGEAIVILYDIEQENSD